MSKPHEAISDAEEIATLPSFARNDIKAQPTL